MASAVAFGQLTSSFSKVLTFLPSNGSPPLSKAFSLSYSSASGKDRRQKWRPPVTAASSLLVERGGVQIARDDVVRGDEPMNNVPDAIFTKLGLQLHRRSQHPIGILKNAIYEYFDSTYATKFDKFDDLCPIVSEKENFEDVLIIGDNGGRRRRRDEVSDSAENMGRRRRRDDVVVPADSMDRRRRRDDVFDTADGMGRRRRRDDVVVPNDSMGRRRRRDDVFVTADSMGRRRRSDDELVPADSMGRRRRSDDDLVPADTMGRRRRSDDDLVPANSMGRRRHRDDVFVSADSMGRRRRSDDDELVSADSTGRRRRRDDVFVSADSMGRRRRSDDDESVSADSTGRRRRRDDVFVSADSMGRRRRSDDDESVPADSTGRRRRRDDVVVPADSMDRRRRRDDVSDPASNVGRRKGTDTYYIDRQRVLRCHTSAHHSELLSSGLKQFLVSGDVYRRDPIDSTHYPVFHQMEGVRVFSPSDWESSGKDGLTYVAEDLKNCLEGLARHLFGDAVEMRWVDNSHRYVDPEFDLEIFFQGKWLEVLGCGYTVTEHEILRSSGNENNVAWAFGLGLDRLAMVLFDIPDIRLFWSGDERFTSQFSEGQVGVKFKPFPEENLLSGEEDVNFGIDDN